MNIHLTQADYDALPKRSELVNDPLTGQMYRDEDGGIVIPRVSPIGTNGMVGTTRSLEWDAFGVTIEKTPS